MRTFALPADGLRGSDETDYRLATVVETITTNLMQSARTTTSGYINCVTPETG